MRRAGPPWISNCCGMASSERKNGLASWTANARIGREVTANTAASTAAWTRADRRFRLRRGRGQQLLDERGNLRLQCVHRALERHRARHPFALLACVLLRRLADAAARTRGARTDGARRSEEEP